MESVRKTARRRTPMFLAVLGLLPAALHAQVDYLQGSGFETDATVQLIALRAAPDGAVAQPVGRALVTAVKPAIGNDPPGFFVQGGPVGPAIFVRVDPATVTPTPLRGDEVSFVATALATAQGRREVTALSGYTRHASGRPLAAITQSVSMTTDLVSNLAEYEAELVTIRGLVATAPTAAGSGFLSSRLETPAIVGNPSLVLRAPTTVFDAIDLVGSCVVDAVAVPMWRFNAQAQVSPFDGADLQDLDCPAPRVVDAHAIGGNLLRVVFDRRILPGSVAANGSQFVLGGGLVAQSASVNGRWVDVGTSTQAAGMPYSVTVATSVLDLSGRALDGGFAASSFEGFPGSAGIVIDEVNANINGNRDLLEVRALTSGSVAGVELVQDPGPAGSGSLLAVFGDLQVSAGDRIVVHFAPGGETDETTGQNQCIDPACYPNAWDVRGASSGILYSNRVIALRSAQGTLLDVLAAGRSDLANPTAAFPGNLQFVQAAGQWLPADCGGQACTYDSTPSALAIAADWTTLGTTPSGNSLQRAGSDTQQRTDWVRAAASFGLPNP